MTYLEKVNILFQDMNYSLLEKLGIVHSFLNYDIQYNYKNFQTTQNIKIFLYDKTFKYFKTIKYSITNNVVYINDIGPINETYKLTIVQENDIIIIWDILYIKYYDSIVILISFMDKQLENIYNTLFSQIAYKDISKPQGNNIRYILREDIPTKLKKLINDKQDYINNSYKEILNWLEPRLLIEFKM